MLCTLSFAPASMCDSEDAAELVAERVSAVLRMVVRLLSVVKSGR